MKALSLIVALGALLLGASHCAAAPRTSDIPAIDSTATVETLADGTEILIEHQASTSLHWSPARGFHHGRNCCKSAGVGRASKVSSQRFAGIDAAAGRPMYFRRF